MKKSLFIILICIFSFKLSFSQEKVYMPLVEVLNIHTDYQYTISKLFKTYVDNNGKYEILLPYKSDTVYFKETFEQSKLKAAALNTPYFVIGELNRIGETVVVVFSMYKTSDGTKIWSDLLKAQSPEDLDPIIYKLAKNIGTENKAGNDGDIYNVTEYDSKELNKINANLNFGISVGGTFPFVNADDKSGAGFGLMASYDVRDMIFDIGANAYFSSVDIYYMSLKLSYPFSDKRHSPYLGGGLGFGGMNSKKEYEYEVKEKDWLTGDTTINTYTETGTKRGSGLMLFAGGGYIINRNSNVQLRVGGDVFFSLYDVNKFREWNSNIDKAKIADIKNPIGIIINMTILFGK